MYNCNMGQFYETEAYAQLKKKKMLPMYIHENSLTV